MIKKKEIEIPIGGTVNFKKKKFESQVEEIQGLTAEQKRIIIGVLKNHFLGEASPKCNPKCFYNFSQSFGLKVVAEGTEYTLKCYYNHVRLF